MTGAVRPVYLNPGVQADALGAALRRLGFAVQVLKSRGHHRHPCVVVDTGPDRVVKATGYVYAAPGRDGQWWFWQPSAQGDAVDLEPIAPISAVSVTADAVSRTLTRARILGRRAS